MIPLLATFGQTIFMLLLGFVAVFLILLVLVQRGRGGGLAGALGGMGGSSAFGAKAGDVFTKVTVVAATLWIVLCIAATKMTPSEDSLLDTNVSGPLSTAAEGPALGAPADSSEEEGTAGEEGDSAAPGASESDATKSQVESQPESQPGQAPAATSESDQTSSAESE
jgi:preprotein translocase subunit SecG